MALAAVLIFFLLATAVLRAEAARATALAFFFLMSQPLVMNRVLNLRFLLMCAIISSTSVIQARNSSSASLPPASIVVVCSQVSS